MTVKVLSVLVVVLAAALVCAAVYVIRLRHLLRGYGTFQCGLRHVGARWGVGVMKLDAHSLSWFSRRSITLRPKHFYLRDEVEIVGNRPSKVEHLTVVSLRLRGRSFEAAMRDSEFAGMVSWIDSAPPAEEPSDF